MFITFFYYKFDHVLTICVFDFADSVVGYSVLVYVFADDETGA